MKKIFIAIVLIAGFVPLMAQDTLPDFTVISRGNRVLLSWKNQYPVVKQINIQRSFDSTRNFTTIMSIPDPKLPENGFVDPKPVNIHQFYRLFILLDSGKYVFTVSKRPDPEGIIPGTETSGNEKVQVADDLSKTEVEAIKTKIEKAPEPEKQFAVMKNDTLIAMISEKDFKKFRDSVVRKTPDTLLFNSIDSVIIKPFRPKVVYKPSKLIYTQADGNVAIRLEDAAEKNYYIKFFDEEEEEVFQINKIREKELVIDKAVFLHAGWYFFEIYNGQKLIEKHKFYIPGN